MRVPGKGGLPPVGRIVVLLLVRPRLWRTVAAFVPDRWWTRWPPLPLPPKEYRAFRNKTMFGDSDEVLGEDTLLDYLEWCRRMGARSR